MINKHIFLLLLFLLPINSIISAHQITNNNSYSWSSRKIKSEITKLNRKNYLQVVFLSLAISCTITFSKEFLLEAYRIFFEHKKPILNGGLLGLTILGAYISFYSGAFLIQSMRTLNNDAYELENELAKRALPISVR